MKVIIKIIQFLFDHRKMHDFNNKVSYLGISSTLLNLT